MKKFSSMLALGLALAMTLGMTVSAAPSVSTANSTITSETLEKAASETTVTASNGVEASVTAPSVATYDGAVGQIAQASVAEKVRSTAKITSDVFLVIAQVYEVSVTNGASLGSGTEFKFTSPKFNANTTYVALHQFSDGTWEVLPVTVSGNTASVTLKSLSPVAFVEVQSVSKKSPKTGETDSAALWMAVFCAIGASLYAVKARGSRQ